MKIYSKLKIKNIVLKNRIIIEPIVSKSGNIDGTPSEKSFEIYEKYANAGAGMVIMEQIAVHPWGRNNMEQFKLYNDEGAIALRELTKIFENKNIPVDCAGGIRTSKKAEELLKNEVCELIGIARPILKNENFLKTF